MGGNPLDKGIMSEADLHQLSKEMLTLRHEFETHLALEKMRLEEDEKWKQHIDSSFSKLSSEMTEVCQIIKDGKQSWKTILFAGGIVVSFFTFIIWAINFVFQFKDTLGKIFK